jgi:hypothetical protein
MCNGTAQRLKFRSVDDQADLKSGGMAVTIWLEKEITEEARAGENRKRKNKCVSCDCSCLHCGRVGELERESRMRAT